MSGLDIAHPVATPAGRGGIWFPRGHILHDYLESRVMPIITGPIGRGNLQYTAMWKAAQRFTKKPVKFGAVSAEIVAFALQDRYYKSVPDRMFAIADAFNEEYHELADAGCPVIQIEEPQIHLIAVRKIQDKVIKPQLMVEVFNRTVKGLARQDRSVGAFLLGQSVAAAHVRAGAELQAGARDLQHGRCRRHHVRIVELRRHRPRSHRQDHHREEDRHRRHRPSHAAGRNARTRWRRKSAPRSSTFRRSGW